MYCPTLCVLLFGNENNIYIEIWFEYFDSGSQRLQHCYAKRIIRTLYGATVMAIESESALGGTVVSAVKRRPGTKT